MAGLAGGTRWLLLGLDLDQALIPVMAEASIITKPMMDITGWNWTPSTRAVSPATKTTPAKAARRRWTRNWGVPLKVSANFGSSASSEALSLIHL